jgi:predicted O-linked N-acetylglucosamine transferase (SPINDLY family)
MSQRSQGTPPSGPHSLAVGELESAAGREPGNAEIHKALGNARKAVGDLDGALAAYRQSVSIAPRYLPSLYNIGLVLRQMNRLDEAERHFRQVHELFPGDAEVLFHVASLLASRGCYADAERSYRDAMRLDPGNGNLQLGLARVYTVTGALDKAIECYQCAVRLQPDSLNARGSLLFAMQGVCDWSQFDELSAQQRRGVLSLPVSDLSPFTLLSIPSTPAEQLACARKYAEALVREAGCSPSFQFQRRAATRLRIGYLSGDFREHASATLFSELFELHDRKRFEVIGYSQGPDDRSPERARLIRAFDRFVDVSGISYNDAAAAIFADRIDILVDLKGHTELARLETLALRPAPVQVTYLGYPGTTGADFIDYAVVDRIVAPPEEASNFSEQLIHLPASYQVNDRKRPLPETGSRRELGLPDGAFVFCCFNASYKIVPDVFAAWMRLLRAVPGSVLWLLENNPWVVRNLCSEASRSGIPPDRLVFTPRASHEQHLARAGAADLFLDTFPCNAHTTASDVLWVGLPVLTCAGTTFASRVGASLLNAVGLPELVTHSMSDYEALAVRLARNPDELAGLRDRLRRNRSTAPLFDTPSFVRHLETAYLRIWDTYVSGGAPSAVQI